MADISMRYFMSTKPNQPKDPSDWIDFGEKLVKLARKEYDNGYTEERVIKELNRLLKKLDSLAASQLRVLRQLPAKRIERHVIDGDATKAEVIIYKLNDLGMNKLSSQWKRFGRQIADAKHVEKFYPVKVTRNRRQSFEDACLYQLDNREKELKDNFRYEHSSELDTNGLRLWLKDGTEDREGKHKHKYDTELMFILENVLWNVN
jgi:hypothetical protein